MQVKFMVDCALVIHCVEDELRSPALHLLHFASVFSDHGFQLIDLVVVLSHFGHGPDLALISQNSIFKKFKLDVFLLMELLNALTTAALANI